MRVVVVDDEPVAAGRDAGSAAHDWSQPALEEALQWDERVIYVYTGVSNLPSLDAERTARQVGLNLGAVAERLRLSLEVISRGDATLRGHFPGQVDALADGLEQTTGIHYAGRLIIPAALDSGRYTISNVHWVSDGVWAEPAGQTVFARDAHFGYHSSDLRNWVAEKTQGAIAPESVETVTLADIREGGPDQVAFVLDAITGGRTAIVNAASYQDMVVFVAGLLKAEERGKHFIFRTAASFVDVRAGMRLQGEPVRDLVFARGVVHSKKTAVPISYLN